MKVYELIADAVAAEGVDTVFAVMGDGNMKWLAALEAGHDVRVVYCRHEATAAGMAEGYARLSGRPGICSVTCGPGLSLIATTLIIASRNRTPLLVIAGESPRADRYYQQRFDQSRFAQASEATPIELRDPDSTAEDVCAAFALTRGGQPVVFSAAFDIQEQEIEREDRQAYASSAALVGAQQAIAPASDVLDDAARMLAAAQRPAILAGRGALGARAELLALADRTGAVVATTLRAKGFFHGHPRDVGVAGGLMSGRARTLLDQADLLVAVGASLNQYTTHNGTMAGNARVLQISVEREELLHGRRMPVHQPAGKLRADCYVQGDAAATVRALVETLPRAAGDAWEAPLAASDEPDMAQPPVELADGTIHPRDAMTALSRVAREDSRFVIGLGHFWWFPIVFLTAGDASSYLVVPEFGAIGQSFAAAMGAAAADPSRPVVFVEGDGSLMMSVQELDTAVRYGLNIVVVVMNDGGLAAEFHKLDALGLSDNGARIATPDFAKVAEAFGARGARAESLDELETAVARLQAAGGPAVIDAQISDAVVNDSFWHAFFAEERRAAY
jgi:acetolactate synthase I/II/III large subunit